ncbi:fused MFS/spermidine synthase, partial [Patescibacteria group bacterium]|nr:fused MFS/spermidine synthase [Patescibacteria group bacterium]
TMMSIAGVLAILGLLVIRGKMRAVSLAILIVVFFALLIQGYDRPERVVYEKESPYQLIRVEEYGSDRYLIFNDGSGTQSVWFPTRQRTDMYYDHLAAVPLLLNETDQHWRTAVLGLAGGSLIRQYLTTYPKDLTPDIVGVEVDPSVIDTARRFFAIDELPIQIVNEDGRTFLARTQDPFDVIIIDAYSTQLYIPPHMVTEEFFSSVRDNLTVGGLTAMNVNAPQEDSALLQAITNTAASVFPFVYMTKAGSTWNWLVVASDQPLDYLSAASRLPENYGDVAESLLAVRRIMFDSGQQVLTDDRAPIELMTDKMIIADALRYMGER